MKKWMLTIAIVLALAAGAISAHWWGPPFWAFLGAEKDQIGSFTALLQVVLTLAGLIVAVISAIRAATRGRGTAHAKVEASRDTATIQHATAQRDLIASGRDTLTGGQRISAEGDIHPGGDVVVRDKIVYQVPDADAVAARSLHQLPSVPRDFVGRKEELDDLRREVRKRGAIISCRGMGGVGKTALALVLAHEIKDHYPNGQIFLDLKGTTAPLAASAAMAHVIQSFHPEAKLPDNEAALQGLYHEVLHGKGVLLLMDNAASRDQVAPLVPSETGVLLVTTRQHFALEGLYSKDLDILPPKDARELLLEICRRIGEEADRIANLCGRLPLALRAAASLLATTPDLKPEEYAARLADERTRLEAIGAEGVDIGVEASFGLSYDALGEEAKGVFTRLSVFPAFFDAEAEEIVCEDPGHAHLTDLMRRSLVEFNAASDRYRLHDLVRLFAAGRVKEADRAAAEARHAAYYKDVLARANDLYLEGGEDVTQGLALFDLERENVEAGREWAVAHARENKAAARLCSAYPDAGTYVLDLRQHPRERIGWLESALAAARSLKDPKAEGLHLGNLGLAYADLGETRRAIEYHEKALEIDRDISDRRGEGQDLGNLGNAYLGLGETRRAIEYHEKALAIHRKIGDRRGEGAALGNLGNAYADLGETRRAIEYHEKALEIDREIGDRRGEGQDLGNLGNAYAALGETRRAIEYYEKVLAIHREIGDRRGEGNALGNLGNAYADLGETRRAIEYYEQALAIDCEIGDRRGEATDLYNMADEYAKLGDASKAVPMAETALKIFEQIEDPNAEMVRRALKIWRNET